MRKLDLTGMRFGELTVCHAIDERMWGCVMWVCKCDCGNSTKVSSANLTRGNTSSCGHLRVTRGVELRTTHGLSDTPEYMAWGDMIKRCTNPNDKGYHNYGGRGISVCYRWLSSFENFYADMGPRPSDDHSIDRRDNDGNYEPGNCHWATKEEQDNNRRTNRVFYYKDKRYTISQLAKEFGINYETLRNRLNRGWSIENAVETPIRQLNSDLYI